MSDDAPPAKFDADFIERRMREHRQWQESEQQRMALELIEEIAACLERPRMV